MNMSDKSKDIKRASEAIELLDAIEDVDGVKEYIDGEDRPSVISAAEKRIAALAPPESTSTPGTAEVAKCDTWRYHKTHQPRIFKKDSTIPPDWNLANAKLWARDAVGAFMKIKE